MLIRIIGAGLTVICFSICFEIPKRFLLFSGFVGGFGWGVYLVAMSNNSNPVASTFIAAMVITILSQFGARIYKAPVTLFLIAGILPLVPGAGMYQTVYYILHNDRSKSHNYFVQTLLIAGAIALAIFVIDSIYRLITNQENHLKERHFFDKTKKNNEEERNI